MGTAQPVTAWKRAAAWTASLAIGTSLYFVFGAILTADPSRERADVQQRIEALMTQASHGQIDLPSRETEHVLAGGRATLSLLGALQEREAELMRKQKNTRIWALLIAFVAFGGCFALCTAQWWIPVVRQKLHRAALAYGS